MGTYTEIILSVRKRVESNNKVINGSNVTETSSVQPTRLRPVGVHNFVTAFECN